MVRLAATEAISLSIDLVRARKEFYREAGIAYYRPWIFVINDSYATDSWAVAARGVNEQEPDPTILSDAD
jgi:uncharacterized protein YegL